MARNDLHAVPHTDGEERGPTIYIAHPNDLLDAPAPVSFVFTTAGTGLCLACAAHGLSCAESIQSYVTDDTIVCENC